MFRVCCAAERQDQEEVMVPPDTKKRVLVVGSINVDLYQRMPESSVKFDGSSIDVTAVRGMTLPAKSFVETAVIAAKLESAGLWVKAGKEEAFVLKLEGPFDQKTGGKGANAAAAAGQTSSCEFIGNLGSASAEENRSLLSDLHRVGKVKTDRCALLDGPTGTAYILLFPDNDNAIVLLGGANQAWPEAAALKSGKEGGVLRDAIKDSCAVMLQREIPEYVNVIVAQHAKDLRKPVFMDVGGTDAPLDPNLLPLLTVLAPNESELTFISGVATQEGGEVKKALLRDAVTALKAKCAAVGNEDIEVLVTLGKYGAMYFAKAWSNSGDADASGLLAHECQMGCFELATADGKPKDTCGAGDCFRGSFVSARFAEGKSLEEAMRWSAAAGSLSVEQEGALTSMPTRSEIEARAAGTMQDMGSF